METKKPTQKPHAPGRESPAPETLIRTASDARQMLAALLTDERELAVFAVEFFKLGSGIAGRAASPNERASVYKSYLDRILSYLTVREGTARERSEAVSQTLEEMRAENRDSTPL